MWSPLWSVLVCKIPQFWAKVTNSDNMFFYKVGTSRLLKIHIMFCPSSGAKERYQLMDQQDTVLIDGNKPFSKKHEKRWQLYLSIRPGGMRHNGKRAVEVAIIHNKPSKRGYFLAQFQFIWDLVGIRIYYTIFELQLCNRYFFVFHETF